MAGEFPPLLGFSYLISFPVLFPNVLYMEMCPNVIIHSKTILHPIINMLNVDSIWKEEHYKAGCSRWCFLCALFFSEWFLISNLIWQCFKLMLLCRLQLVTSSQSLLDLACRQSSLVVCPRLLSPNLGSTLDGPRQFFLLVNSRLRRHFSHLSFAVQRKQNPSVEDSKG